MPDWLAEILKALIHQVAPIIVGIYIAYWRKETRGSLEEIHGVVNSRLTAALKTIEELKDEVRLLRSRDV